MKNIRTAEEIEKRIAQLKEDTLRIKNLRNEIKTMHKNVVKL